MHSYDPFQLARRQLLLDRTRTKAFPFLLPRKVSRMQTSPLGFLRGSAPLFYEMLKTDRAFAQGPLGEGWIAGDLHVENFGAYRCDHLSKDEENNRVLFNLNDFDDAIVGPWRFEVLRLMTSVVLAARSLGAPGASVLEACDCLMESYCGNAMGGKRLPAPPGAVKQLLARVESRTRQQLLDGRTEVSRGKRRFSRGERYLDLSAAIQKQVPAAFANYRETVTTPKPADPNALEIVDSAFRVAGTGSLGQLRIAVMVQGKGNKDGHWLFEMKEEIDPSPAIVLPKPRLDPALRVIDALRACLEHPPRMIGTSRLGRRSLFVRRLAPQEDRIDFSQVPLAKLTSIAAYFGALAGAAHRRGALRHFKTWNPGERAELQQKSIALAGIHESAYLAFCRLTGRKS